MSSDLAAARWAAEASRAARRGLLTTKQAAQKAGVQEHTVKTWKRLGLLHDFGGGKGYPSLFDPEELRTAPARRVNLRARGSCTVEGCDDPHWAKGKCSRHYRAVLKAEGRIRPTPTPPSRNAESTIRKGKHVSPPRRSPYRMLARTCPSCGTLLTTPPELIRKSSGPLPRCHGCLLRTVSRNIAKRQAYTVDRAHNNGKQWTGPEMELVLRGDLSVRQLALRLGRTIYAVRYIKRQLAKDPRYIQVTGMTHDLRR